MKRRYITVPIDKNAEFALDYDEATNDQLLELVLCEDEYIYLNNINFFKVINEIGGANIDDYESESITEKEIIIKIIDNLKSNEFKIDFRFKKKVEEIINLFEEALNRETGIYFYF